MRLKNYYTFTGIFFALITIAHAVRAVQEWPAVIAGYSIPVWVSWVVVVVAGYLSVRSVQLCKRCDQR